MFTVLVVGAISYFVPLLDCPLCDDRGTSAQVGDVSSANCISCQSKGELTVVEYLQEFPVKVKLPEVKELLPGKGAEKSAGAERAPIAD